MTRIYTKKSKMSSGSDHMAMEQILANQSLIIISIIFLNEYWMTIDCKFIPLWLKNASIFIIMTIDTLVGNAHHQGLWLWRWMGPLLSSFNPGLYLWRIRNNSSGLRKTIFQNVKENGFSVAFWLISNQVKLILVKVISEREY